MRTLVVEYADKKLQKEINEKDFGMYNFRYRQEIENKYKEKIGLTKELEYLATELDSFFDIDKDMQIANARELTNSVREYMRTVNIYML